MYLFCRLQILGSLIEGRGDLSCNDKEIEVYFTYCLSRVDIRTFRRFQNGGQDKTLSSSSYLLHGPHHQQQREQQGRYQSMMGCFSVDTANESASLSVVGTSTHLL